MRVVFAVGLSLALVSRGAGAAPSLWDRARDPQVAKADHALTMALRARQPRDVPLDALAALPAFESLLALRAATVLELAGGEALENPEVWYFLGEALIMGNRGRDEDGRRILRRAIEAEGGSPEAAHAWFQIAIASNRLRDFAAERDAYGEALRLQWDKNQRAGIYMNRGEASMSLGKLTPARDDYETALSITDDSEIHALAAWGLAVALARDDDLPDALRHAWDAAKYRFHDPQGNVITALELPSVFFTPPYEVFYYRALGAMAAAEHADKPESRKTELDWAIAQWQRYLAEAKPVGDRWLTNVEYQRRWCERRLSR